VPRKTLEYQQQQHNREHAHAKVVITPGLNSLNSGEERGTKVVYRGEAHSCRARLELRVHGTACCLEVGSKGDVATKWTATNSRPGFPPC